MERERERKGICKRHSTLRALECQTYIYIHGGIVKIRNRQAMSKASDRSKA